MGSCEASVFMLDSRKIDEAAAKGSSPFAATLSRLDLAVGEGRGSESRGTRSTDSALRSFSGAPTRGVRMPPREVRPNTENDEQGRSYRRRPCTHLLRPAVPQGISRNGKCPGDTHCASARKLLHVRGAGILVWAVGQGEELETRSSSTCGGS